MASSFLSPPNFDSLSNAVISGVLQRADNLHSRLRLTDERDSRAAQSYTKPREVFSASFHSMPSRTDKFQPKSVIGQQRLPDLDPLAHQATKWLPNSAHGVAGQRLESPPPLPRKVRVSASRRERCRINQARYRDRQRVHTEGLDKGIHDLQEEIRDLETQRRNILRSSPTNESVWVVAIEYFRLFRYGYIMPVLAPEASASSSLTGSDNFITSVHRPHVQLDFLKSTMVPDVTDGSVCGPEALLENWKLLSLYGDVHVQVKRLEQVDADSLLASTKTSLTITETTLRKVFPHLVVDGEEEEEEERASKWSPLAQKLLNQRVVLSGSVRFDWEASTCRVVRLESKVDLLAPMLRLLGNLEDVAGVFDKALVTPEGRFRFMEMAVTTGSN